MMLSIVYLCFRFQSQRSLSSLLIQNLMNLSILKNRSVKMKKISSNFEMSLSSRYDVDYSEHVRYTYDAS